ncbi:RNA polymerase sigma factor [Granulosicoccus antarcticus]|uniref:ECF RNA polymerase sigma factor SigD n=1 Tax=Granulosicoccus antarcticus IMCC3135 TaxID=1192854 RepID=A0A2Z2NL31_9GAMM|nr:RNA polymerase sigma factor [Granulosicoccus antarcticus]ASJ71235.1 ECF RNA polymerase sigma factor SigD [Granulosicoccus antarcticus IMCC3135]
MDIQSTQSEHDPQRTDPEADSPGFDALRKQCDASDTGTTSDCNSAQPERLQADAGTPLSIDAFLQSIERRAFVMARYALKNEDDALDAVQDAMLKLCESYADRPGDEWGPLFYRILQNGITDRVRPRGMNRLKRWVGRAIASANDAEQGDSTADTMDYLPSEQPGPQDELVSTQQSSRINHALSALPAQQREVFLLRRWQGLSVRETAEAMDISEGSVKTHLSRAVSALQGQLQEKGT